MKFRTKYLASGPNTRYDGRFYPWTEEYAPPEPYFRSEVVASQHGEQWPSRNALNGSLRAELHTFPEGFLKVVWIGVGFPAGEPSLMYDSYGLPVDGRTLLIKE